MPLNIYPGVHDSGNVPDGWKPIRGGTVKYPVRNKPLLKYLRTLIEGRWQKVIKLGNTGEVHYFEHASGAVADVKYIPRDEET